MKANIGNFPKRGYQKIKIKIEQHDTWSADNTLAQIIYPMLLQLKDLKQGVPSEFVTVGGEDWQHQQAFDFYREGHNEYFEQGVQQWDAILDKMIWSFEQILKGDYGDQYHHGDPKYDWVKSDKMYPNPVTGKMEETYQMVDKNPDEHWYDSEGHAEHDRRIQEGLDLFGKHFRSLWT